MNEIPQPPSDELTERLHALYRPHANQAQQRLPDIWQHVQARLATTAQDAPQTTTARVHPFVEDVSMTPTSQPTPPTPGQSTLRRPIFSLAAVLLAVAIVATAIWFGTARSARPSTPAAHPTSTSTANTCPPASSDTPVATPPTPAQPKGHPTDQGITLQMDHAYADATQTVIDYSLHSAKYALLEPLDATISDSAGNNYILNGNPVSNSGLSSGGIARETMSVAPLPLAAMGHPNTLLLTIITMDVNSLKVTRGSTAVGDTIPLHGLWQVPFTVIPPAPHAVPFQTKPVTHCGITITPQNLVTSSDTYPYYGPNPSSDWVPDGIYKGGARLELKISGLPQDTLSTLVSAFLYGEAESYTDLEGIRALSDFPQSDDWWINWNTPLSLEHGDLILNACFITPLPTTTGTVLLSINDIYVQTSGHLRGVFVGPWDFQLHLGS